MLRGATFGSSAQFTLNYEYRKQEATFGCAARSTLNKFLRKQGGCLWLNCSVIH